MAVVNPLYDETTGLAKLGNAAYMDSASFIAPTGNSSTATALQIARSINGVAFDGTQDITITAQRAVTFSFPGLEAIAGDSDDFIPVEAAEFIGAP